MLSLLSRALGVLLTAFRDASTRIEYTVISQATFANQHAVDIFWSKPQEVPQSLILPDIEIFADPYRFTFTMTGLATPDSKQSEACVATYALFYTFSGNAREEKVGLRLPPAWRDLWSELSDAKKIQSDSQDRAVVKELRDLVRKRQDQELEDGVILQGAFRGRAAAKVTQESGDSANHDRARQVNGNPELYKKIWTEKSSTRKYQTMLVSWSTLSLILTSAVLTRSPAIAHAAPHVGFQATRFGSCGTKSGGDNMWRDRMVGVLIPVIIQVLVLTATQRKKHPSPVVSARA
jgi:hypothetical protein